MKVPLEVTVRPPASSEILDQNGGSKDTSQRWIRPRIAFRDGAKKGG